jgi:hypothetical protein
MSKLYQDDENGRMNRRDEGIHENGDKAVVCVQKTCVSGFDDV